MPDDWIVVQVGPVCRIPGAARYGIRRRWWYVYQRSRLAGVATEREVDPWVASAHPDWVDARSAMHRQAGKLRLPWHVTRGNVVHDTVAYYAAREEAERLKALASDRVEPVEWGAGG